MPLFGKFICFAIVALAMDLIWGYAGILSLGHGLFFALGGYAMGMYLMRSIRGEGVYRSELPDFMVFLDWKELPWYWYGFSSFHFALAMALLVPGLLAFVFGYLTFRSRIRGVYFSIVTQALTYAAMLLFFRNNTGFGGNNGLTDFKRILGYSLQDPATRLALFVTSGTVLLLAYLACRFIVTSKFGRTLTAIRDAERGCASAATTATTTSCSSGSSRRCCAGWRARSTCPRSASSTPARCSRPTRSRWRSGWRWAGAARWSAGVLGAWLVNGAKSWLTVAFPSAWLYFLGALFILVTLFLPRGLVGLRRRWFAEEAPASERPRAQPPPPSRTGRQRRREPPPRVPRTDRAVGGRHHRQLRRLQGPGRAEPDPGEAASSAASSAPTAPARPP